jgi:hypothetical protein
MLITSSDLVFVHVELYNSGHVKHLSDKLCDLIRHMEKFLVIYAALGIKTIREKLLIDPIVRIVLNERSTECTEILI